MTDRTNEDRALSHASDHFCVNIKAGLPLFFSDPGWLVQIFLKHSHVTSLSLEPLLSHQDLH